MNTHAVFHIVDCCAEIICTSGLRDGQLIGYVLRRPWVEPENSWFAYRINGVGNLINCGRFATPEEAAKAVS